MQILVFILLKLIELGLLIFIPWLIGLGILKIFYRFLIQYKDFAHIWMIGFMSIIFGITFIVIFLSLIPLIINLNWGWASMILGWF